MGRVRLDLCGGQGDAVAVDHAGDVASIAQDENLTATQRDNAKQLLDSIASMELALIEMLARGEELPNKPSWGLLQ